MFPVTKKRTNSEISSLEMQPEPKRQVSIGAIITKKRKNSEISSLEMQTAPKRQASMGATVTKKRNNSEISSPEVQTAPKRQASIGLNVTKKRSDSETTSLEELPKPKRQRLNSEVSEDTEDTTNTPKTEPALEPQLPVSLTWEGVTYIAYPDKTNRKPRLLTMDDPTWLLEREQVETIIDYKFNTPELLREAMYPVQAGQALIDGASGKTLMVEGNRKLAHIGDTVLKTTAIDTWHWCSKNSHELHDKFQVICTNKFLAGKARDKGLSAILKSWFQQDVGSFPGRQPEATTMEAIIGAVWYDSGRDMEALRKLLDVLLDTHLVSDYEQYPVEWKKRLERALSVIASEAS